MNKEEIFDKMVDLIVAINKNVAREEITINSTFEDLNMDSLDGISIITDLEKQYNIVLSNEEVNHIRSISQAVDVIQKHLAQLNYAK
jgi:acyl carrier protein